MKMGKNKISKMENRPKEKCKKGTTGKREKRQKGKKEKYIEVFVHLRDLFFQ